MFKKVCINTVWLLNGVVVGMISAVIGLWIFEGWVSAATYNVFFNNVEQGANSTASPTVNISGGKKPVEEAQAPAVETPATPASPVVSVPANPQANAGVSTAKLETPHAEESHSFKRGRLGILAHNISLEGSPQFNRDSNYGGTAAVTFFPLANFGLTAFGGAGTSLGAYGGAELEFIPLKLSIFDWNALEAGLVVGASTIGRGLEDPVWGTMHAGVTAGLNFGEHFGITAGLRTNLTARNQFHYWLADAGLTVRF